VQHFPYRYIGDFDRKDKHFLMLGTIPINRDNCPLYMGIKAMNFKE
jgi:hypothetical protein